MSDEHDNAQDGSALVSMRTMDLVVAPLIITLASVFIFDSVRIGIGWGEGQGPAGGLFPFWISLIIACASVINLLRIVARADSAGTDAFVSRIAARRVMLVLVPTAIYVASIQFVGIYLASAIFIVGFMLASRQGVALACGVGLGVPVALFMMFERWFLVPLPKGPIETMFGF